jgi:cytochrome c
MTGPSLAGLWNQKAGTLASFSRYSPAMKSADIEWNDKALDEWIEDPQHLVPGNEMTFAGIKDARQRADLLAFLKQATQPGASVAQQGGSMGGMGGMGGMDGMMGGRHAPNLKKLDPEDRVQAISYCKDTYAVTTANGQTRKFWERNLRLKTDASADGPQKNAPALVGAGMMGDRADVIFADPSEISSFITGKCE